MYPPKIVCLSTKTLNYDTVPFECHDFCFASWGSTLPSEAAEAFPIWEILSILPIRGDQEEQRKEHKSVMQCAHSK